ncbi:hypothetical protein [Brucella anthropi]|uniref:hypothetical protein n=1 Tax=Brucella anthropi TaxID=529 RepID=UPI0023600EB9|nr:hypothetical protein [Brucella anthropi]
MTSLPEMNWTDPVLPQNPEALPKELPLYTDLPEDFDPLAEGILMEHQSDWIADQSDLKLCGKGRRAGITFAEALDDTLVAASKRSAGGQNVFYIGDTKDKGREFIGYVKQFAKTVAGQLLTIFEFMFEDKRSDGTTHFISAYRAVFASGFRVEALSSRPENIRGLQGIVVIDEAAFHGNVREVLDAVNALLIWGGKIRIISSHNGVQNPFNELIKEARAGKVPYSIHEVTFGDAVRNGLFKRVCFMKGEEWTPEKEAAWEQKIRAAYGVRTAAMHQELDAIPAEQEGSALTRVLIESCMKAGIPVIQWACTDNFKSEPDHVRTEVALEFCETRLLPLLKKLDPRRQHVFGEDFARKGDATVIMPLEIGLDLVRRACFQLELRNVPYDQQREILFYVVDRLPRMSGGALDATGNGAYLAEKAKQRYGASVVEVSLSVAWYKREMPPYIEAFSDKSILLPAHADTLSDHQALAFIGGVIQLPDGSTGKGADGFDRHGDSAIAGALGYYASRAELEEYGYQKVTDAEISGARMFEQPSVGGLLPSVRGGLF